MRKLITLILGIVSLTNVGLCLAKTHTNNDQHFFSFSRSSGLKPEVLATALRAYDNAQKKGLVSNKHYVTIIDYSMASTEKRLWVIDMHTHQAVFNTYVAHGRNNGSNIPVHFSDDPRSLESSIGVYVTKNTYFGKNGISLVLRGLDRGFNDKAESRRIVMHGADYVTQPWIASLGRIGRSWGCPALPPEYAKPIINSIKDGSVLIAYYPDPKWLRTSQYLA